MWVGAGADEVTVECGVKEVRVTAAAADGRRHGSTAERQRQSAAHVRTAAMLFVVTVVFLLTFAPAFLMSLEVVPYVRLVFYAYFFNNIANPVIYSFMNVYFRREMESMFCHLATNAISR